MWLLISVEPCFGRYRGTAITVGHSQQEIPAVLERYLRAQESSWGKENAEWRSGREAKKVGVSLFWLITYEISQLSAW